MKQALIIKYLEGETSGAEERELKRLLLDTPKAERNAEEQAILSLLTTIDVVSDNEEDIFEVDHTAEFDRIVGHRHRFRVWTWAAAACVACLLTLCLVPRGYNALNNVLSQTTVTPVPKPIVTPFILPEPKVAEPLPKPRKTEKIAKAPIEESLAVVPVETTPETAPLPDVTSVTSADIAAVEQQVGRALIEKMVVDHLVNEIMIESHQQTSSKDEYTL